jgi:riboflavin biosynthesis pyrimidine reductase
MMQCADRTMVVTDSSKFGRSSLARLCPLEAIHTVVVDSQLDLPWQQRLRDLGTQLFLAELEESDRSEESIRESAEESSIIKTETPMTRRGGPSAGPVAPADPTP